MTAVVEEVGRRLGAELLRSVTQAAGEQAPAGGDPDPAYVDRKAERDHADRMLDEAWAGRDKAIEERDVARRVADKARADLADLQARHARLETEMGKSNRDCLRLQTEIEHARTERTKAVEKLRLEIARLGGLVADDGAEMERLRAGWRQAEVERDQAQKALAELQTLAHGAAGLNATVDRTAALIAERDRLRAVLEETPSFDEAWAAKEAQGYRYGADALEQVRLGWDTALAALRARAGMEPK